MVLIFALGAMYKIPFYTQSTAGTVFTYLFTSALWGVAASYTLVWFEQHSTSTHRKAFSHVIHAPAYKRYSYSDDEKADELSRLLHQQNMLLQQVLHESKVNKKSIFSRLKF